MRSLFEKRIERAERELRDLKTAHPHGPGTVRFYAKTAQVTGSPAYINVRFTSTIAADEPAPGFIICLYETGSIIPIPEPDNPRVCIWQLTGPLSHFGPNFKVICSSAFSLTMEQL